MSTKLTFSYERALKAVTKAEVQAMEAETLAARKLLAGKSGAGNDFVGWVDLPVQTDLEEYARIKKAAAKIRSDSEYLVVVGIGGSYLGARAGKLLDVVDVKRCQPLGDPLLQATFADEQAKALCGGRTAVGHADAGARELAE